MKKIIFITLAFLFLVSCQTKTAKNDKSNNIGSNDTLISKPENLKTENSTESNSIFIRTVLIIQRAF